MNYKGKLYGKIGNKYFDTSHDTYEFDFLLNYHAINETSHAIKLFNFFRWFQINGEKYENQSIEKMINIYLGENGQKTD